MGVSNGSHTDRWAVSRRSVRLAPPRKDGGLLEPFASACRFLWTLSQRAGISAGFTYLAWQDIM